ncbi:GTP-binding protein Di-Ras3 [Ctenodactylus gundi]
MGNSCFGIRERLCQRLRPILAIYAFLRHLRSKDFCVVVLDSMDVGQSTREPCHGLCTFGATFSPNPEDASGPQLSYNHGVGVLYIARVPSGPRHPCLKRLGISKAHAFILVFPVTRKETLQDLEPFYELIREAEGHSHLQSCPLVLVGNRREESRRDPASEGGTAHASTFMDTSARVDINIQELFHHLQDADKNLVACLQETSERPKSFEKLVGESVLV